MLSFSLVAEALTGLIYHRPSGENSKFLPPFNAFGRLEDGGRHVNVRVHLQEYQMSSLRKVFIMGDKSRRARRGKSKRRGRRQKTEEATLPSRNY